MIIGRRGFLVACGAVAGGGLLQAGQAAAAPMAAHSVAEFGVDPRSTADQTKALQKAIDEITTAGEAVHIPGGRYLTGPLSLPARCAIMGVPGLTQLSGSPGKAIFEASENISLSLTGLGFDGGAERPAAGHALPLIAVRRGDLTVSQCVIERCAGAGIAADEVQGTISSVAVRQSYGPGFQIPNGRVVAVSQCVLSGCETGIDIATAEGAPGGCTVSANHLAGCATGIAVRGSGTVSGNFVTGSSKFGLRLGGMSDNGAISATGNTMTDCAIAIGVAAGEETMLVSLNLIVRAGSAAIRAFHGDKLVGPDLARESAESYLNLTVAGNVFR